MKYDTLKNKGATMEYKTIVRFFTKSPLEMKRIKTKMLAQILDLYQIDFERSFNVQISEEELSAENIAAIADKEYKRADGQYVCNGMLASMWEVEADIRQKYIKLCGKIMYVETITQPIIQTKWEKEKKDEI